jgi:hypothetical protein
MIEAWFELERMKASRVPSPCLAGMLKTCEERVRGAIMHLASETMTDGLAGAERSGGAEAVRLLWMEVVVRGEAETAAALAELRNNMTDWIVWPEVFEPRERWGNGGGAGQRAGASIILFASEGL